MPADPELAIDDVIEVVHRATHTVSNAEIINVFHYRVTVVSSPSVELLSEFTAAAQAQWEANLVTNLHETYKMVRTDGKRISGASIAPPAWRWLYDAQVIDLSNTQGTQVGDYLPQNVTASIAWQSGFLGRFWRGGSRLSPMPTLAGDATDQNKIGAAFLASLVADAAAFRATLNFGFAGQAKLGVASLTYYGGVLGGAGPVANAFADYINQTVNPFFRTQNSRLAPHVP